jgi:hypothetical protein
MTQMHASPKIDGNLAEYLYIGFIRNAQSITQDVLPDESLLEAIREYGPLLNTDDSKTPFYQAHRSDPVIYHGHDYNDKPVIHRLSLDGMFNTRVSGRQSQGFVKRLASLIMDGSIEDMVKGDKELLSLMQKSVSPHAAAGTLSTFYEDEDNPVQLTRFPILYLDSDSRQYIREWQQVNEYLPVLSALLDRQVTG